MEVWEWWPFIRRRIKTIVWIDLLVIAVTMGVTFVVPPTYRSVATLTFQPVAQDQSLSFPSASQMGAKNAGELIKSPTVTRRAAESLGKSKLEGVLEYRVPEGTGLIEITDDAKSPQLAAAEANAVARTFLEYNAQMTRASVAEAQKSLEAQLVRLRAQIVAKQDELATARSKAASFTAVGGIQDEIDSLQTGYDGVLQRWQSLPSAETLLSTAINFADEAVPDPVPVAPRPILNLILAVAGGLLLGLAVARATEPSAGERETGS